MDGKERFSKKEIIVEIEQRLQIIITVMMFFPAVIDGLFKISSDTQEGQGNIMVNWGISVVFFIIVYLIFEHQKSYRSELELLEMSRFSLFVLWQIVGLFVVLFVYPIRITLFGEVLLGVLIMGIPISALGMLYFCFKDIQLK